MVYFIRNTDNGAIKIGKADDPEERLMQLQTASAHTLTLIGVIPGSEATESTLHSLFSDDRMNGEWFSPSKDLLGFIEAMAKSEDPLLDFHELFGKIRISNIRRRNPEPEDRTFNGYPWCESTCPNHGNWTDEGYEGIGNTGYRYAPPDDYPDLYWRASPNRSFYFCNLCGGLYTCSV